MKALRGVWTACFPSVLQTAGPLGRIAGEVGRDPQERTQRKDRKGRRGRCRGISRRGKGKGPVRPLSSNAERKMLQRHEATKWGSRRRGGEYSHPLPLAPPSSLPPTVHRRPLDPLRRCVRADLRSARRTCGLQGGPAVCKTERKHAVATPRSVFISPKPLPAGIESPVLRTGAHWGGKDGEFGEIDRFSARSILFASRAAR